MAEAYIGEIRIFAGNFPPKGWALCDGQLMSIQQNT
ncbi:phage tail protein, partial [Klebsiella pneumoniae]